MAYFRRSRQPRLQICVALLLLFLATSLISLPYVLDLFYFERYLDTRSITFDDFPTDYVQALNQSMSSGEPFQYDATNSSSSTTTIPRIIHHIWFTGISKNNPEADKIPDDWAGAQTMCKNNNPGYKIYMWNADDALKFLQKNYPWFVPIYEQYPYSIERVDALKYFLLWHYGGVYVDLDVSCRRLLDPLLEFEAWFPRTKPVGVSNDLMASRPGHPVFGRIVDSLAKRKVNLWFTYLTVFWSTGPQFLNSVLREWAREDSTAVVGNDISILPGMFYSEEYSFFGHRAGSSWHRDDAAVVAWVWRRLWVLMSLPVGCTVVYMLLRKRKRTAYRARRKAEGLFGNV